MFVFFSLTRNTFRECLREPVFFLILASALLLILSFPLFTFFTFNLQVWAILESSMAATMFLGFIAAVICSDACMHREAKNGTLLLLLSKPVSRFTFLLAKVAGIAGCMIVFSVICAIASMTMVLASANPFLVDNYVLLPFVGVCVACGIFGAGRNFFSGASFAENTIYSLFLALPVFYAIMYNILKSRIHQIDPHEIQGLTFVPCSTLLPAMLLLLLAIVLMSMITTATAQRFSLLTNLVFTAVLLLGGLTANAWFRERLGEDSFWADLCGVLFPAWQNFWMAYPVSHDIAIPLPYVGWMALYVVFYGMIWVIWAGVLFHGSELAKDSRV